MRVALTGLAISEYFRDEEGKDVSHYLSIISSRFTKLDPSISLLGRMPSAVGYQPNLATEMGELQERSPQPTKRSITSVQAVYVPADDPY